MKFDEKKLIDLSKPYLEKGRAGDWNHALRVVKWVKLLGEGRKDKGLLITAAYLHDIGWSGVMKKGKVDFDEMLKYEEKANKNTPVFTRQVLEKLNFDEKNMKIVIRLIGAADRHEAQAEDEEIIVDADSLSKLCIEHLREKYSEESYGTVVNVLGNKVSGWIKTEIGKKKYPELLSDLKEQLNIH